MATQIDDEAEYWSRRAEKERRLAQECRGKAASSHRARASRYSDLAHRALRQPLQPGAGF